MFDKVLALVAPHNCVGCGAEGALICRTCAESSTSAISRCYKCHKITSAWRTCPGCRRNSKLFAVIARSKYAGAPEALVRKLKYDYAVAAADEIALGLLPLIPNGKNLVISCLPTATSRVRRRGFDQARLIAKRLSERSGLPSTDFLARLGQARQVGASRIERIEHASKMFQARHQTLITGKTVLLVDDVITTGASLEAAARLLRVSGARRIYGLVFCQA